MRFGKTKTAIDFAGCLYFKCGVRRVLVITVTSGLGVWEDQVPLHCPLDYRVIDWHGELRARSVGRVDPITFCVVNFQNAYDRLMDGRSWTPVPRQTFDDFIAPGRRDTLVVIDESHHIGKPSAVQSRHAYRLGRNARYRVFMTGSMFHRKPFYVFGQAKFWDDGATFGTNWNHFKKRIAVMGGYGGYEVKRYKNMPWMMREMRKFTYVEKAVKGLPPVENLLHFDLTGKGLQNYLDMAKHKVIEVNGQTVASELVITLHLRLLQISGGFVKLPEGGYAAVGKDKVAMLEDRLREYLEQDITKAVVGCRFIPELRAVGVVAKKLGFKPILFHGGVPRGDERKRRIATFQDIDKPALFISQISTGKESIDLSVADTMLWYSLTESFVEYDQFRARIAKYKDTRTLMYDFLIARGTRDEVTFEAMQQKQDVAELLLNNPRKVHEIATLERSKR